MDKNNRKLQMPKVPYGSICYTQAYHQLKYSSPNRAKKNPGATQESLPFGNGGLGKKKSGEWAKSRKGSDRKSKMIRQKEQQDQAE